MDEVLAKAEKYINGEEALIYKKESSSTHKESDEDEARKDKATMKSPQGKIENDPQKGGGTSEIVWVHRKSKDDDVTRLSGSLP